MKKTIDLIEFWHILDSIEDELLTEPDQKRSSVLHARRRIRQIREHYYGRFGEKLDRETCDDFKGHPLTII